MSLIRNASGQVIGAQMITAADGSPFTSAVTYYVTGDGGTQVIGTTNSGVCVHEGHGYHTTVLAASETDFSLVAYTFVGTGAVNVTIQAFPQSVPTLTPTTGTAATGATTALNLIADAFGELNVFLPGEDLPAADANAGLRHLNGLLGQWAQQSLTIPASSRNVFPYTVGKGSTSNPYTIGPGGDFDVPRPANPAALKRATNLLAGTVVEAQIAVLSEQEWNGWTTKDLPGTYVTALYYQPTFTSGLGTITTWPVLTAATHQLVLYLESPLSTFADLTTSYVLPPAYYDGLLYGLARRLAKPYGREVDADLKDKADRALAIIKRSNLELDPMGNYFTSRAWWDIQSGTTYVR